MSIKILFGGDVMFGRYTMEDEYIYYNQLTPLNDLREIKRDVFILSLNGPICHSEQERRRKEFGSYLRNKHDSIRGLINGGVDVVSFANKHSGDFTEGGVIETLKRLERNGIGYAGASRHGNPERPYIDHDKKYILFSTTTKYSGVRQFVSNTLDIEAKDMYVEYVKGYREMYPEYIIINSIHWGAEYSRIPDITQSTFAKKLIDIGGSDIIMGTGSHIKQRYGEYNGKIIMYNLGNLYYNHTKEEYRTNPNTHKGALYLVEFKGREIINLKERAVWVTENKATLII